MTAGERLGSTRILLPKSTRIPANPGLSGRLDTHPRAAATCVFAGISMSMVAEALALHGQPASPAFRSSDITRSICSSSERAVKLGGR
jgi:hypothetical protein